MQTPLAPDHLTGCHALRPRPLAALAEGVELLRPRIRGPRYQAGQVVFDANEAPGQLVRDAACQPQTQPHRPFGRGVALLPSCVGPACATPAWWRWNVT